MKELIEYYYDIHIEDIDESNNVYSFLLNGSIYILVNYLRTKEELEDIIKCSLELKNKNIISNEIILNRKKEYITVIDELPYSLLKLNYNYLEEIDITKIISYNKKTKVSLEYLNKYKNNWGELWSKKIDYLEYQVSQLALNKRVILDSFSYYIGLAENAISYVNKITKDKIDYSNELICLSHRRISYPNINMNYFNPLSYIFDIEVRDIAEYIKSCFFKGEDAYLEFITFIKSNKLSSFSYQMFFIRMLYPTYYFDIYEKVISDELDEDALITIISKVEEYELFIKKIYLELSKYTFIEKIDWLLN